MSTLLDLPVELFFDLPTSDIVKPGSVNHFSARSLTMKPTDGSKGVASFGTFFAGSTGASVVLMHPSRQFARNLLVNRFVPTIIPELQNQEDISVVLGDYRCGALMGTGGLLTWDQFLKGALGLGDPTKLSLGKSGAFMSQQDLDAAVYPSWGILREPPCVDVPTRVRFDHGEKRKQPKYYFGAAALGWHAGALVIDLDPDGQKESEELNIPGSFTKSRGNGSPLPSSHFRPRHGTYFAHLARCVIHSESVSLEGAFAEAMRGK